VSFTVGFDLDMTLIDPRAGMVEVFDALAVETGLPLDGRAFVTRLGPPLAHEFARYGITGSDCEHLVQRYRELYPDIVVPSTVPLPGAVDAVQSVLARGGKPLVVTAKFGPTAQLHMAAMGLAEVIVVGDLWASSKAVALREHGAEVYVGDHLGDITGARAADALSVAVATGPISATELAEAGADVVLNDLTEFPAWLNGYLLATVH
jgi:phosphoglycolate phosphatase